MNDTSLLHVYVNGQYLPEIHLQPDEFKRLRYINAIANNVAELVMPGCEMFLLAMDGIYRDRPVARRVVILPPGGRADVAVRCKRPGIFFIESESSPARNHLLGKVNHHRVPSQRIVYVSVIETSQRQNMTLPETLPNRPAYMMDPRADYEFSVWIDDAEKLK